MHAYAPPSRHKHVERHKHTQPKRVAYRAHDSGLPVEEVITGWSRRTIGRRVAAEVLQLFYSHSTQWRQPPSSSVHRTAGLHRSEHTKVTRKSGHTGASASTEDRTDRQSTLTERHVHDEPQPTTKKHKECKRGLRMGPIYPRGLTRRGPPTQEQEPQNALVIRFRAMTTVATEKDASRGEALVQQPVAPGKREPHGTWSTLGSGVGQGQ